MTERIDRWPAGAPCWADIMVSDLDRSMDFYATVLGWRFTPSDPAYGGYCNALVDGEPVVGMSPALPEMEDDPHAWAVYLASDDIVATGRAAVAAGARQLFEPMAVGSFGTMGVWIDPTGAAFGVWQPQEHTGFSIVGKHGAVAWCDLLTTDQAAAERFYAEVFGYTYQDIGDDSMPYALFTVPGGERPAGGMGGPVPDAGDAQPGWGVAFQVEDVDEAAERIRRAGGSISSEPSDFEYGRMAVAAGPDGEVFVVMTPSETM